MQEIGGVPLVDRAIRILTEVEEIDHTILYGSCESILDYISAPTDTFKFIKRPIWLDDDATTFNDILDSALTFLDTDYIVFMTYTSPFIKPETICKMIQVIKDGKHDSAFTATSHNIFTWFNGEPLNYKLGDEIPKTQDLSPVLIETSSVYIFAKKYYEETGRRIGENPYIHIVDKIEGWDIDTMEDLKIARRIADYLVLEGEINNG